MDVGDKRAVPRFPFATRVIWRKDEARLRTEWTSADWAPKQGVSHSGRLEDWKCSGTVARKMPYGAVPRLCLIISGNGTRRKNQLGGLLDLCSKCACII